MRVALDDFVMGGIGHNIPFLSAVMEHDRFISGDISTAFIDEEYKDGFTGIIPSPDRMRDLGLIISAAAYNYAQRQSSPPCQDWAIQFVTDDTAQIADANLRCSFHLHQQDAALTADISPYADTAADKTNAVRIEIQQAIDTPQIAASITDDKDDKTRHICRSGTRRLHIPWQPCRSTCPAISHCGIGTLHEAGHRARQVKYVALSDARKSGNYHGGRW